MAIKTEVEQVENEKHTVVLKVEIPYEEIGDEIDRAYQDIAKKVKIPGFRKGKIPKAVIDQRVGKDAVLHEALHEIIPFYYPMAVESSGIEPVIRPEIDVLQLSENEPIVFTAKVQVKPEVKLGSLGKLKVELPPEKAVKEEIDNELDRLRDKFATLDVVKNRVAKTGDYVLIDYEGYIGGKPFEGGRGGDYMLELGSGSFIPGFEDQLVNAKTGVDVEVKVAFPKDYHAQHLAGQEAAFKVKVKEIKTKKQPKVDDEFAKNVSKFETLKELKADVKKTVDKRLEAERTAMLRTRALDKMVELSELDLPSGMVDQRIGQMMEDFGRQIEQSQGVGFQQWLAQNNMVLEQLVEKYRGEAERSLKTELVLETVVKQEDLAATDKDLKEEIKELAKRSEKPVKEIEAEFKRLDGHEYLKYRVSMNKAVEFLAAKAKIKKEGDAKK